MKNNFLIFLILALFLLGCTNKNTNKFKIIHEKTNEKYSNVDKINFSKNGVSFYVVAEGSEMISSAPRQISNKYLLTMECNGANDVMTFEDYTEYFLSDARYKKYNIKISDLKTNRKIKEINLKKIIEDKYPNMYFPKTYYDAYKRDGKNYFTTQVSTISKDITALKRKKEYRLELNIDDPDDNKLIEMNYYYDGLPTNERKNDKIALLRYTNMLDKNGIFSSVEYTYGDDDYLKILIDTKSLPKNNKKLYSLFPDLKKIKNENNKKELQIFLKGNFTSEEVLSYLIEDGKKITFDGVETESGDEIRSEKEFDRKYIKIKDEEKNRLVLRQENDKKVIDKLK